MISIFTKEVSSECSRTTTEGYSTSLSSAITASQKVCGRISIISMGLSVLPMRSWIPSTITIKAGLLLQILKSQTYVAIEKGISLNPILHSFQLTVNHYKIDRHLIDAFFRSMESDLQQQQYDVAGYEEAYIYGSAEVVGLMCLYVFCRR